MESATVGSALLDVPEALLRLILEEVCARKTGSFSHALVCWRFLHLVQDSQKAVVVREDARLCEDALLHLLCQFPNLTSIRLHKNSGFRLPLSLLATIGRTWGRNLRSFSASSNSFSIQRQPSRVPSSSRPCQAHGSWRYNLNFFAWVDESWEEGSAGNEAREAAATVAFASMAAACPNLRHLTLGSVPWRSHWLPLPPSICAFTSLKALHLIWWTWECYTQTPPLAKAERQYLPRTNMGANLANITGLVALESLSVGVNIQALPAFTSRLSRLTQLSLVAIYLTSLSHISSLPSLRVLMLSSLLLKTISEEITSLVRLRHLVLDCPLQLFPDTCLASLSLLRTLSTHCPHLLLPDSLASLLHLTLLYTEFPHFSAIKPRVFQSLTSLEVLGVSVERDCSREMECMLGLQRLRVLSVFTFAFEMLVDFLLTLGRLPLLEELSLNIRGAFGRQGSAPAAAAAGAPHGHRHRHKHRHRHEEGQVCEVPEELGRLRHLRVLVLHSGEGHSREALALALPHALGELSNLEELQLFSAAGVVRLPGSVSNLLRLQRLGLHFLRALTLPQELFRLTWLKHLEIVGLGSHEESKPRHLPEALSQLRGLKTLKLSRCHTLVALPVGLSVLTGLIFLDISNCQSLQSIPLGISLLTALGKLRVDDCPSAQLPPCLTTMSSLRDLSLDSTPQAWLQHHLAALLALPNLSQASRDTLREEAGKGE